MSDERNTATVSDVLDDLGKTPILEKLADVEVPEPLKEEAPPEDMAHRQFEDGRFWKHIPRFKDVSEEEFLDHRFQNKNSVTSLEQLTEVIEDLVDADFLEDVKAGLSQAPMNMRLSPYVLSLIDWDRPYRDPIRIQFIPVASQRLPNHPRLTLDSLHEQKDSPTPGLVHRYPDKALFLPIDVCPVYCRFCTRSYAIGGDTGTVDKVQYRPQQKRWEKAFAYIASRPELEDIVISGGDMYMMPANKLEQVAMTLLAIPHVRRIRFASKGAAVMPMKILSDTKWTDAMCRVVDKGRELHKEVCLHTHFNSSAEITDITRRAMNHLFERGVQVRNQSVLIRHVNDSTTEMTSLIKQLSYMNVQPYYVYQHDMVMGVEDLRTTVGHTVELERHVRGATAGFNTPTFVNDVPGGGGKRDVHSYDHYDPTTGVSVYRSPVVDDNRVFLYFDPLHLLPEEGQQRWADEAEHDQIVREAIEAAGHDPETVKI
ncbi:MAG: KamA family radical SAM protein [Phycisphaeraceae bacterium]